MLPPFRVRCMQRPACSGRSIQTKNAFNALVRISAPEYDNTIRTCPEASLKYLDEDDGETITVGSSLELIERLRSPLHGKFQSQPCLKTTLNSSDRLSFTEGGPCPTSQKCHMFGIDCRISSLDIWREIEQRSKEREAVLQSLNCSQLLESEAVSKHEGDVQLFSRQEVWEKTAAPISPYRSVTAEHVYPDDLKVLVNESDDVSRLQELEEIRTAYFQSSNPPQVKPSLYTAGSREVESEHNSELNDSCMENPLLARATAYPSCNLTLEGKRQAQAAGDKLRARTTHSRSKREFAASIDQASYQNRWASYNDPTSSFHFGSLAGFPKVANEPKPSLEGKRQQSQLAGDKLRCRTNPVRHVKSLRGPTDYGVNKNRRCSLAGSRVTHCSDRAEPSRSTDSSETRTQRKTETQTSLLQVFETEFAKISSEPSETEHKEVITYPFPPHEGSLVPSLVEPHVLVEESLRDAKTSLNGMEPMGPQPCAQVLELAIRATLITFRKCAIQIANCVQEISAATQLANKTRDSNIQVLDKAVASFRSFTEEIAALEMALDREPESTGESGAKTDRREYHSSLRADQALNSSCTIILWPIPSELESKEIQDILLVHIDHVKTVFISEAKDGGLRLAFCAVKDVTSAQTISREMAGQMLNGNRLNVVIVPEPEKGFLREENDVFEEVAAQEHSPSLVLQKTPVAGPPSTTSLPTPSIETSTTMDVFEERNQNIKPAETNILSADQSKPRSESKPAQSILLPSNYTISGSRLNIVNDPSDFVEAAIEMEKRDLNWQMSPADTGNLQPPFKDDVTTCSDLNKGINFDSEVPSCSQPGSRPPTKLHRASIPPLHEPPTHVLGYHGHGPPWQCQHVPVFHGKSSPQSQPYLKSHRAVLRSGSLPSDEYADAKLVQSPVPCTPSTSAPDLCGKEFICSLNRSSPNSALPNVEDHRNPPAESSIGRFMFGRDNTMRASRSMGTLFQHDDLVEHGQIEAGEDINGRDRSVRALLEPNLSRMTCKSVCAAVQDKPDFSNYGARSSTELDNFRASGFSARLIPASSSSQSALSESLDQQLETSPLTSRFPTLEQFEGRHFEPASRIPKTSGTIRLIDPRPRARSTGAQCLKPQDSILSGAGSGESVMSEVSSEEKRLNTTVPDAAESSGEFFNRMTRQSPTYHLPSTSPDKRGSMRQFVPLAKKHSCQANFSTPYRNCLTHNVRRCATTARLSDTIMRTNRRPYSESFGGNGRVTWDSFLHKDDKNMNISTKAVATPTNRDAQTALTNSHGRAASTFKYGAFDEDLTSPSEHSDPASVQKVQECVSQLQRLGFGGDADGGTRRLVVYAQATEGDLLGAIDMIDEEKRAYKERNTWD